jgi:hypothetical protein
MSNVSAAEMSGRIVLRIGSTTSGYVASATTPASIRIWIDPDTTRVAALVRRLAASTATARLYVTWPPAERNSSPSSVSPTCSSLATGISSTRSPVPGEVLKTKDCSIDSMPRS